MKVAYKRVSSINQNIDRQLEGIDFDREFVEKISGKDKERKQLQEMILFLRQGDELYIHSLDRLGRNLKDLQEIIEELTCKGVIIHSVKENITFSNDNNPMNKLLFHILGAFSEFERELIKERQREGIMIAQKKGIKFGRRRKLNERQIKELKEDFSKDVSVEELSKKFNLTRQTIYNYLR